MIEVKITRASWINAVTIYSTTRSDDMVLKILYSRSAKINDEHIPTFNTCAATLPSSNCCTRSLRFSCCTMPPAFPTINDSYLKAAPKRGRTKGKE